MEDSKFFKKVWRFNALLIAAVGMAGIGILLVSLAFVAYKSVFKRNVSYDTIQTQTSDDEKINEVLEIDSLQSIEGSDYVMMPLISKQYLKSAYSSKSKMSSTRNLLFANMNTGQSHWLFSDNSQLVLRNSFIDVYPINEASINVNSAKVVGILYKVIKSDSNKDGQINEDDKLTVALTTAEGKNYTELSDIDDFIDYKYLPDKNQLSLLTSHKDKQYIVLINLLDFSVTKTVALPEIAQ